jgi:5'-methylthioinosine phosphorylase
VSASTGLIVGSGFDALPLEIVARSPTKTPYGPPSSAILTALIGGERVACIVRYGETHAIAPHEVNYRANVWALYQHGARRCIGVNVVGAIAPDFEPGELAVPRQLIDYTSGRSATFGAAGGRVSHVEFAEPFDTTLRSRVAAAVSAAGFRFHEGVYGVTQGPRLETAAEIDRLARDGCTMVGMTAMPEAALARELGLRYAICALAVNRAAGRAPDGTPIHAQIERHRASGMRRLGAVLERLLADLGGDAL